MLAVNIAIFDGEKVLLTMREDFEIWCLPGSHVDDGETLAQAARREANEEIGLDVTIEHMVGTYSRDKWWNNHYHVVLFKGSYGSGEMIIDPHEVKEARFFPIDALPEHIFVGHRQRCLDAYANLTGIVRHETPAWPLPINISRSDLYRMRDESGMDRCEWYLKHIFTHDESIVEVQGQVYRP